MEYIIPREVIIFPPDNHGLRTGHYRKQFEPVTDDSLFDWRIIFNKSADGFVYLRYLTDSERLRNNYIFLDVNRNYEILTGLKYKDVAGRLVTEIASDKKEYADELINRFYKTAESGYIQYFDIHSSLSNIDYTLFAYCPRKHYFIIIFNKIPDINTGNSYGNQKKILSAIEKIGTSGSIILEQELPYKSRHTKKIKMIRSDTAEFLGISGHNDSIKKPFIVRRKEEVTIPDNKKQIINKNTSRQVTLLSKFDDINKKKPELFFMIN